ncbi:unnamed protein product [Discosporangium mesarthrocarpum]
MGIHDPSGCVPRAFPIVYPLMFSCFCKVWSVPAAVFSLLIETCENVKKFCIRSPNRYPPSSPPDLPMWFLHVGICRATLLRVLMKRVGSSTSFPFSQST